MPRSWQPVNPRMKDEVRRMKKMPSRLPIFCFLSSFILLPSSFLMPPINPMQTDKYLPSPSRDAKHHQAADHPDHRQFLEQPMNWPGSDRDVEACPENRAGQQRQD